MAGVRPGVALAFTILAFNTLGDGMRDALGLGAAEGQAADQGPLGLTTVDAGRADAARRRPRPTDALLDGRRTCRCEFLTEPGAATVVDDVSFGVAPGEIARRSSASPGSGKTVTSLAVMRLVAVAARSHHRRAR